ncbi:TonB-dependent receptor plug domain-containing protein [Mucilaginibacter sp.]|jgi:vitamin B12 transporter|uniref:TonB-dependent receptor plug domain-containing protein n=1 Tax=Mucilaginibacter sp. TaxID=1882438 RepID=UPI002CF61A0B|nr:TonB-dependent receptor [Mucilaginibacter sp.]HTI61690.1 TonB-dependent receptor [Mucilaginibacter sp.]
MKKNYFRIVAGLGLVQLGLLSMAVYAQDTTRVLNNVVVTATRSPKKLSDIGRVVTVITPDQISRSQGKTLPQLLNTVPGLTFSGSENAPGISSAVYLRGASSGNTLILVDGFPVSNASGIDGTYDLNAFPVDQIDHIEILKGSGSTLYGSDAVAGVINIITKHAKGQGVKASVQLVGGSYNTFNESVGLNGNVNNTGIALNLSNADSRGFAGATDTTGNGNFRKDDFHQRSLSLNLTQKVTDKFSLNGNLQTSYNKGHLPYGAFTDDQNYTYANTFLFGGLGAKLLVDKGALNLNVSQNTVWNHYNDLPNDANFQSYYHAGNIGRITNAELVFTDNLGKYFDITSGADLRYNSTHQLSNYDTIQSVNNNIVSAYTSLFFKSDIFHMELGGRYNHYSKYGDNFTYTINPSFFVADQLKIFGTIASAFKAPSLYQLSSQYGNIGLKPETTTSYEAGFDWTIINNVLTFNTVFYKRDTKDVIYFNSLPDPPYGKYENGSKENDKGYESELTLNLPNITASAYVAHVTGALTNADGTRSDILYRRPKNTFGANVNYKVIKTLSIGLNYKYTGDRVDQDFSTFPSTNATLKHYNLVDAHVQWQACKKLAVFGDLKNVFNEKYTDWLGYNTRGTNFMAGLRYQIN